MNDFDQDAELAFEEEVQAEARGVNPPPELGYEEEVEAAARGVNPPTEMEESEEHDYAEEHDDDDRSAPSREQVEAAPSQERNNEEWGQPWQQVYASKLAIDSSDQPTRAEGAPIPPKRVNETSVLVTPMVTKSSPLCADPRAENITMEHVRQSMLLETDPNDGPENKKKWYTWANDDGSKGVILRKAGLVLDKTDVSHDIKDALASALSMADGDEGGGDDLTVYAHCPAQRLLPEADDRGFGVASKGFVVNEHTFLKSGRNTWRPADATYRRFNTQIQIEIDTEVTGYITFRYDGKKPVVEVDQRVYAAPPQELLNLLDFAQYTERELAELRPPGFIPMKTLQQLTLLASPRGDISNAAIPSLLAQLGDKVRFDEGAWRTWKPGSGWQKDDSDVNIRTALKAAATDVQKELYDLSFHPNFGVMCTESSRQFGLADLDGVKTDEEEPNLEQKARTIKILPTSERGLASFVLVVQPWAMEEGFAKSFEKCKSIAFGNVVQEMEYPYATHIETPADRVVTRIDCDLPPPPQTHAESLELQRFALKPFKEIFLDDDVALREADKAACLLTGTCAVMPEANIRPQIGPYNESIKQFAGRVGKDTIGNHFNALLGDHLCTDWGMAMLSAQVAPDKNNHGFQGLEKSNGHWITDASARRNDEQLRKWGDLPKKIWAGGAPSAFPVTLKHKDKALILPRSNACYVSAQRLNIGDDTGIWSRLEPSPYPRVANIKDNQSLIDAGCPSFEMDPNYVNEASNMDRETPASTCVTLSVVP
jgi:hypothetical protein